MNNAKTFDLPFGSPQYEHIAQENCKVGHLNELNVLIVRGLYNGISFYPSKTKENLKLSHISLFR